MAKLPGMEQIEERYHPKKTGGEVADRAISIYLKKPWGRDIPGVEIGSCIGVVTLAEGVDLNLLVDAIRNGVAGEERPEVE